MEYDELLNAYESLKRKNDAVNKAVLKLEKKVAELQAQNSILNTEKAQWELEKFQQQAIIQQTINNSNETSNKYLEENRQLRDELRKFKGE